LRSKSGDKIINKKELEENKLLDDYNYMKTEGGSRENLDLNQNETKNNLLKNYLELDSEDEEEKNLDEENDSDGENHHKDISLVHVSELEDSEEEKSEKNIIKRIDMRILKNNKNKMKYEKLKNPIDIQNDSKEIEKKRLLDRLTKEYEFFKIDKTEHNKIKFKESYNIKSNNSRMRNNNKILPSVFNVNNKTQNFEENNQTDIIKYKASQLPSLSKMKTPHSFFLEAFKQGNNLKQKIEFKKSIRANKKAVGFGKLFDLKKETDRVNKQGEDFNLNLIESNINNSGYKNYNTEFLTYHNNNSTPHKENLSVANKNKFEILINNFKNEIRNFEEGVKSNFNSPINKRK